VPFLRGTEDGTEVVVSTFFLFLTPDTNAGVVYPSVLWGFGLVVRAAGWHAGDLDSILGRDGLYTFGCIPPAP
jgi:hypothetical protein